MWKTCARICTRVARLKKKNKVTVDRMTLSHTKMEYTIAVCIFRDIACERIQIEVLSILDRKHGTVTPAMMDPRVTEKRSESFYLFLVLAFIKMVNNSQ